MTHPLVPPYDFPPPMRRLLEQAGWYPGRVADPPVKLPASLSYPPEVLALLRELGGLRVGYPDYKGITFEPTHADDDKLEAYSEELGRTLYPIGVTAEWWDVCVDMHGSVYKLGNWFALAGKTFVAGLSHALFESTPGLQLNEDDHTWGPDRLVITWPELPSST
ncbi:SUKH-3 domain-containing protein [Hymenobacter jeollabukensis]|uniref:SUKH-3 domain containing protein n=1 Tax=Hymenobacter jeollabukensis TaxID=2025313 RepID=A0A5R8WWI7_9BACT|nr:SUKH-3 domain-containing protein [Hymenobacter jeollabukensis]TLM96524.1 hypothetical protein FDY95_00570 [Hymenobacter jeollabukensis]